MTPSVIGVIEVGNIVPWGGIEPTYIAVYLTIEPFRLPDIPHPLHTYLSTWLLAWQANTDKYIISILSNMVNIPSLSFYWSFTASNYYIRPAKWMMPSLSWRLYRAAHWHHQPPCCAAASWPAITRGQTIQTPNPTILISQHWLNWITTGRAG